MTLDYLELSNMNILDEVVYSVNYMSFRISKALSRPRFIYDTSTQYLPAH